MTTFYTCVICFESSLLEDDLAINHVGHSVCFVCNPLLVNYDSCPYCRIKETLKSEEEAWKSTKDFFDEKQATVK